MPPSPDFAAARRQLRRARIQDALGLPRNAQALRHRDVLVESLARAAASPKTGFERLSDEAVDMIVSVAVTPVEEDPLDALRVNLMAVEALAADGQFARLAQMATTLSRISEQLRARRPVLAAAAEGLARFIAQDSEGAAHAVAQVLRQPPAEPGSVSAPITDFLMASTLRRVVEGGAKTAKLETALELTSMKGDGLGHSFLAAVHAFECAANEARLDRVLPEHDRSFHAPELLEYMAAREREILFPAQIAAIRGGAMSRPRSVVALPTSSGKTFLAELRIASILAREPAAKVIYIAPYRLLARQVEASFSAGLSSLGATVQDLGGRFDTTDAARLSVAETPSVAIVTPERLDSLLRLRGQSNEAAGVANELFEACRLIIFDELQLLGRRGRGPRMELLLTRLMMALPNVEFLGLSAASHGADSLSQWLTGSDAISGARRPTGTLEIAWATNGELVQRVGSVRAKVGKLARSKRAGDDAASLILQLDSLHRPILAVCVTRSIAESLAARLGQTGSGGAAAWWEGLPTGDRVYLNEVVEEVRLVLGERHPLSTHLLLGIAVHHAGIPDTILRKIEGLAHRRILRIVCATTTVAEGSDLPFKAVVIPHLNFPGKSRRLERDLYLNLIGRAGRANVSIEGLVFLLESDAPTLRTHVRASLWGDTQADRVRSVLESLPGGAIRDTEDWEYFFDVQSQVMGWLGDGDSYFEDQAQVLAQHTFGAFDGTKADEDRIAGLFEVALGDLESRGFALAASPYRLTDSGRQARLTGLSAPSVTRLSAQLDQLASEPLFAGADARSAIGPDEAGKIATLAFQSFEVLRQSLWLRRLSSEADRQFQVLRQIALGQREWPSFDDLATDVALLSSWLRGRSYMELAQIPSRAKRANSLFGGDKVEKLTSDATEYVGQLVHPVLLTLTAAVVLNGSALGPVPTFLRNAIELGVSSESAVELMRRADLTRIGAVTVSSAFGASWEECLALIRAGAELPSDLALLDRRRLNAFVERAGATEAGR